MLAAPESPRRNLLLLSGLRALAIVGQSAAVATATLLLHIPLAQAPLWGIIAALAVVDLLTLLRIRQPWPVRDAEFFAQLLIDMLGLAGLLYFTGGASNPFTSLFIIQVIVAAIILPPLCSWLAAAAAIALYTALMVWKVDVPLLTHAHTAEVFTLHVEGMWINFLLLALIMAWFVTRLSQTLRRQERLLAEAEQVAALGALATGAAHDLGTPLATIAILAGDYADAAGTPEETKRAATLREQVARCKAILSHIAGAAGVMRAESGQVLPLDVFLQNCLAQWREVHPKTALHITCDGTKPAPPVFADHGVKQALFHLLGNACDAARTEVHAQLRWGAGRLHIFVTDDGPGIAPEIAASLGEPGATTKPAGLGMGLYLTQIILRRLGGTLTLTNLAAKGGQGTQAQMTIPLRRLLA